MNNRVSSIIASKVKLLPKKQVGGASVNKMLG